MKFEGPITKWWLVVYAIFTVGPSLCTAQDQTVGTLVYNPELYADGYTLVFSAQPTPIDAVKWMRRSGPFLGAGRKSTSRKCELPHGQWRLW